MLVVDDLQRVDGPSRNAFSDVLSEPPRLSALFLATHTPGFDAGWVKQSWVFKAPYAQPVVTTEYRHHIPPHETPLRNVYLANMFQVYPQDRGQNYSVRMANQPHRLGSGSFCSEARATAASIAASASPS